MNFLMAGLGANITVGLISAVTATTNGVYTLCNNIAKSTATGSSEVKQIIKETDLEMKIRMTQMLLSEVIIDKNTPCTIEYCIKAIKEAIEDISKELEKIHYRMQYNDNLWIGRSVRSYGFQNCRLRLEANIKTLDSRYKTLMDILIHHEKMYRNKELEEDLSESVFINNKNKEIQKSELLRENIHKNLTFMKE